jgi:hypothetical protein
MAPEEQTETWTASDELDGVTLGTAEQERERAKAWMDTAARHARNEEYWRERAKAWMNTAAMHARNEAYWRERAKRAEAVVLDMTIVAGARDEFGICGGG